jgi:hypothetical protein
MAAMEMALDNACERSPDGGRHNARAAVRVRLIGEHRTSEEKKYYVANLPAIVLGGVSSAKP